MPSFLSMLLFRLPMAMRSWAIRSRARVDDRGDVPGWVMVTVMTAILVVAILGVFKTTIVSAVQQAITDVQGGA